MHSPPDVVRDSRLHSLLPCFTGELALIKNAPRAATVTASCDTSCIMIARDDFKRTMGPLSDMLKSNDEIYAKYVLDVTL